MWAVLLAAALAAAGGAARAQEGRSAAARAVERMAAASAAEARRVHLEQLRRVSRAEAHARMPSTMYASTPSPPEAMPSWHPVLVEPETDDSGRPPAALPGPALPRSGTGGVYRIPLFAAASNPLGRQGFARIVNRSDRAGEVQIEAFDDSGMSAGPVTLPIDANETVHFNSDDLEKGNDKKGIEEGTGPPGEGNWRLELASDLDLEVLSYMRTTDDGFLTSLHDLAPRTESGHRVVTFNPGKNRKQVSWLRLVNPGEEEAEVRIEGIDDKGRSPDEAVEVTVPAGASRVLSAAELESGEGEGLNGGLGTGSGKWRLLVSSEQAIEVMSLLASPTGHLTNLSGVPDNAAPGDDGATTTHTVPLFPAASDPEGRQGFVRIINRSGQAGTAEVEAFDDAGALSGPTMLDIGANETLHFNSTDLEDGNPKKEWLSAAIGPPATGDWRLRLSSTLALDVLAYIRTEDGFLTSMHDVAPVTEADHRVVTFNPGNNENQVSSLRLINPGDAAAEVTIEGTDDKGASPGSAVVLSLAGGGSRTLTARELESGEGEGLSGGLGDGSGKWRLVVTADQPVQAMSLLSTPTGHLTNLSTAARGAVAALPTAEEVFRDRISGPVVQAKCITCHVAGGIADEPLSDLQLVRRSNPDHEALNLQAFKDFLANPDHDGKYILDKIQGVGHGGGAQVAVDTPEFEDMKRFLRLLGEDVTPVPVTLQTLFDTVRMAPTPRALRRAALIFAGRIPTSAEYAAALRGGAVLRATIRGLMEGPEFHEFLTRAANDRLLTDRNIGQVIDHNVGRYFVDFVNESYRRREAAFGIGKPGQYYDWNDRSQHGFRRAPVELIAHVVENDLPYTEILTADYIMANPWAARGYGASTTFDDPEDLYEFRPSRIVSYYREGEGFVSEYDPALGSTRVLDPGPLHTRYPHAGLLNTTSFLLRYPTTATNRNRARSRWTYYHFLGLDIEKSASRTTDPVALADTNNPTMHNPACTVCHIVLDPVAGTFQFYGDEGFYKDKWGGHDSLDKFYKREDGGPSLPIRAGSWRNRETLSWPVWMAAGRQTLRVVFTNPFWEERTRIGGTVYLDRLRVKDARGRELARREFEDLGPPIRYFDGRPCGRLAESPRGREDHVKLWWGNEECAFFIDFEAPGDGVHEVEIVAWADLRDQYEGGFARLAVGVNRYREGDTWYRGMRVPGFAGERAPSSDNTVQWLARRIVADERFATAAVEFWWPALMGSEVAEPPEDEGDADFEGRLLAANAQGAEVERLARGFRRGFHGGPAYNLKDLLVEMVLTKWFRADAVEDANPVRRSALRDAGARRLLTPEELAHKTDALTGVRWERRPNQGWPYLEWLSGLTDEFRLLYGGIDSDGVTERARDITPVMAGVAKRHAMQIACAVVTRDFYLRTGPEQRLLAGIDKHTTAPGAIRAKLVDLHDALLGVEVSPYSADVETAYGVFADALERRRALQDTWFDHWNCYAGAHDRTFFEGLLDDIIVENENEAGHRWYDFDWGRVHRYLDRRDWSDPDYAAQAWVVTLAYLLMDYRYLYL